MRLAILKALISFNGDKDCPRVFEALWEASTTLNKVASRCWKSDISLLLSFNAAHNFKLLGDQNRNTMMPTNAPNKS
jgi:hypothetical protein